MIIVKSIWLGTGRSRFVGLTVLVVFGLLGFALVQVSRADSFLASTEAEAGDLQGNAQSVSSSGASADASVGFGTGEQSGREMFGLAEGGRLQHLSSAELAQYLNDYKELGVQWVRTDIDWLRVQAGGQDSWDWAAYDQVIDAITSRDMRVVGILAYPPNWAKPSSCSDNYECGPRDPAEYAAFARAAAERYKAKGVHTWEIWNEPNGGRFTPEQYTEVMKATYPAIKAADHQSVVLAGGSMPAATAGDTYSPVDFLKGIYASGGKNYFDALTHHPYCWGGGDAFDCPTAYADWSAWSQLEATNPSLRSLMTANGDANKKIWLTEMGAPVKGAAGQVSEANQAKEVTDSYAIAKTKPWAGPLFWYSYKDTGTNANDSENWFGLLRYDGSQRPAYSAYKEAASSY